MNTPDIILKTATISFKAGFAPTMINLPVSVILYKDEQVDDCGVGCSQATVLLDALETYRKQVEEWSEDHNKEITLDTIWEVEQELRSALTERLSVVCTLLDDIRRGNLDTTRRREPLS